MGKKAWVVVSIAATTAVATLYRFIDLPVRVEEGIPAWRRLGHAMGEWWADIALHQTFGWPGYLVPVALLALCWWICFPPKRERRRRATKRAATRDVLLHDLRKLRDAYCLYHENNQDGYAASTIGLLTQKHCALFGQVEDHHDAQRRAVDFCIAALEAHSHREAMEVIRERFKHPFRVRLAGRAEIQGTGSAQGEWVQPSSEDQVSDLPSAPELISLGDELWKASPGAGRTVARAIMEAESLDIVRGIFDAHRASPNPKDTAWAAYALMRRMEGAGEGEDVALLAHQLIEEGIDITDSLPVMERDPIFREGMARSN